MTSKRALPPLNREEVLRRNPGIDVGLVAAHERLERELMKLGVVIKPSYDIEPPFGRYQTQIHNESRTVTHNS